MKSLKLKSVLAKAVRRYFAKSDLFTNDLMTLGSVWLCKNSLVGLAFVAVIFNLNRNRKCGVIGYCEKPVTSASRVLVLQDKLTRSTRCWRINLKYVHAFGTMFYSNSECVYSIRIINFEVSRARGIFDVAKTQPLLSSTLSQFRKESKECEIRSLLCHILCHGIRARESRNGL